MKPVKIYTTTTCPFCVRAKQLLQRKQIPFEEVTISWDKPDMWEQLEKRSGMKTVPQIFIGEKCVGGCSDLEALEQSGELDKLLA
jgi:glutaredoxin 3